MATEHQVKQGECISSIAAKYGLFPETIWDDSANADLKKRRGEPNLLLPGDTVVVPDKCAKEESAAAGQRYRFRKKGVPAKFRLRVVEPSEEDEEPEAVPPQTDGKDSDTEDPVIESDGGEERPRGDVPYVLKIDGQLIEGRTDADGFVECDIPPDAKKGKLILEPGTPDELELPVRLGHLDPITEVSGVKERLANLGFECGDPDDSLSPELVAAVKTFQEDHGLTVTGEIDGETRDKLEEVHGA